MQAHWDAEAAVWVATSEDVPGLATEAETIESLAERLRVIVPELLEANGLLGGDPISFELTSHRFELVSSAS